LIVAVIFSLVVFGVARYVGNLRSKPKRRRVGYQREEIQIDMADVPEFKPTWRNAR
jgi:hypothetical protein